MSFGVMNSCELQQTFIIIPYLIFVTGITGGACGEKIGHVEKFLHMTDSHMQKYSTL